MTLLAIHSPAATTIPLYVSVILACGFAGFTDSALSESSFIVDGTSVRFAPTDAAGADYEFTFDDRRYRNTYVLDCGGRRFKWIDNYDLRRRHSTDHAAGAKWRALNPRSKKANGVYDRACHSPGPTAAQRIKRPTDRMTGGGGHLDWRWEGFSAISRTDRSGIGIEIAIPPELACQKPALIITDDATGEMAREMDEIALSIDGRRYNLGDPRVFQSASRAAWATVPLSDELLSAIQSGERLQVITDEGTVNARLEGSREAIDAAYANCRDNESESPQGCTVSFSMKGKNRVALLEGELDRGDAKRVRDRLGMFKPDVLILDSTGGEVEEAMELGLYIRSRGINTRVSRRCLSSCVYLLAAGPQRAVSPGAKVGIHRAWGTGTISPKAAQTITSNSRNYFSAMGVRPELIDIAAQHEEIKFLSTAKMSSLSLTTD